MTMRRITALAFVVLCTVTAQATEQEYREYIQQLNEQHYQRQQRVLREQQEEMREAQRQLAEQEGRRVERRQQEILAQQLQEMPSQEDFRVRAERDRLAAEEHNRRVQENDRIKRLEDEEWIARKQQEARQQNQDLPNPETVPFLLGYRIAYLCSEKRLSFSQDDLVALENYLRANVANRFTQEQLVVEGKKVERVVQQYGFERMRGRQNENECYQQKMFLTQTLPGVLEERQFAYPRN
jgi:hypothetical protein